MQPKSDAAGSGYAPILPVIRTSNSSHNTEELKDAVRRWKNRKNVASPTQKVASTRSAVLTGHSSAPNIPDNKLSSIAQAVDSAAASKANAQDSNTSTGGGAKDFAGPLTFEAIMEIKKKSRVESKSVTTPSVAPPAPKPAPSTPQPPKSAMTNPLITSSACVPAIRTKELPTLSNRIKPASSDGSQEVLSTVSKSNPISAPPPTTSQVEQPPSQMSKTSTESTPVESPTNSPTPKEVTSAATPAKLQAPAPAQPMPVAKPTVAQSTEQVGKITQNEILKNPLIDTSATTKEPVPSQTMTDSPSIPQTRPPVIESQTMSDGENPLASNTVPGIPNAAPALPVAKVAEASSRPVPPPAAEKTELVNKLERAGSAISDTGSSTASLMKGPLVDAEIQPSNKTVNDSQPINRAMSLTTSSNPPEQTPKPQEAVKPAETAPPVPKAVMAPPAAVMPPPKAVVAPPAAVMPPPKEAPAPQVVAKAKVSSQNPLVDRTKRPQTSKPGDSGSVRMNKNSSATSKQSTSAGQKKVASDVERPTAKPTPQPKTALAQVINRAPRESTKGGAAATESRGEKAPEDNAPTPAPTPTPAPVVEKHGPRIRANMATKEPRSASASGPFAKTHLVTGRVSSSTPTSWGAAGKAPSFPQQAPAAIQEVMVVKPPTAPENEAEKMDLEPVRPSEPTQPVAAVNVPQVPPSPSEQVPTTSEKESPGELMLKALKGIGTEVMLAELLKAQLHLGALNTVNGSGDQTPLSFLPHPAYVMPVYPPPPTPAPAPPPTPVISEPPVVDEAAIKQAREAASAAWKERVERVSYTSLDMLVRDLERISASELAKLPSDEQSVVLEHRDRLLNNLLDQVCGNLQV